MTFTLADILRYLKSHELKRSALIVLLLLIVGFFLHFIGYSQLTLGIGVGVLLTSFSDLQGSFRHRTLAMLLSLGLNTFSILIINLLNQYPIFLYAYIISAVFFLSMLTVYGERASMFSLSGLMGIVLSMIRPYGGEELFIYALTILVGGLLYVIISSIYHYVTRKHQINQRMGELATLTASFLQMKVDLLYHDRDVQQNKTLLALQTDITTKQENLRNLILTDRRMAGQSRSRSRQMLLLIDLIDIMELSVANPSTLQKVMQNIDNKSYLNIFIDITNNLVNQINHLSRVLLDKEKLKEHKDLDSQFEIADNTIKDYVENIGLPKARPGAIMLRNLYEYLVKQADNISSLERLLSNVTRQRTIKLSKTKHKKFLTKEDYNPAILRESFSIKSPIFRHAARFTLAIILGYITGKLVGVKNTYWILLTIVVIMRPSYGLTKERSIKRVLGTIIGVMLAVLLMQFSQHVYYFVTLAALSMLFGFSLIQRNYTVAAAAITLNIIFVFALIDSDHWSVISYRLIDTIIGALVAISVGYFILPNWEYQSLKQALISALENNRKYLLEINKTYQNNIEEAVDYRLRRKAAFLATSELNMSFQRFTRDPKSKQSQFAEIYEVVTLNQSLLSSLANLGSYLLQHNVTDLYREFETLTNSIGNEIVGIIQLLEKKDFTSPSVHVKEEQNASDTFAAYWDELNQERQAEIEQGKKHIESTMRKKMQEVRMISEELKWLSSLTAKIKDAVNHL